MNKCRYCGTPLEDHALLLSSDFGYCDMRCKEAAPIMNYDIVQAVCDFQTKFNIPMPYDPVDIGSGLAKFRASFIQEELDEYKCAIETLNREKQLDALCDMIYVIVGTALQHGFWDLEPALARVHQANMRKELVSGEAGKVGKRLIKPVGWTAPDLYDLVYADGEGPL